MNTTTTAGKCYVDNKCDGCQGCVTMTCPVNAISYDPATNTATIDQTACLGYAECSQLNNGGKSTYCEDACATVVVGAAIYPLAIVRA